jgi:hypothetical protein
MRLTCTGYFHFLMGQQQQVQTKELGEGGVQRPFSLRPHATQRQCLRASERGVKMQVIFESKTAIVTYLDSGHLLHTDRISGELYRSRGTWKDYESAKRAYPELPRGQWDPVRR